MATEAYARSLIAEMPLFKKDGQYVPQTDAVLSDIANRIWDAVKGLLKPFSGDTRPLVQSLPSSSAIIRNASWPEGAGSLRSRLSNPSGYLLWIRISYRVPPPLIVCLCWRELHKVCSRGMAVGGDMGGGRAVMFL